MSQRCAEMNRRSAKTNLSRT